MLTSKNSLIPSPPPDIANAAVPAPALALFYMASLTLLAGRVTWRPRPAPLAYGHRQPIYLRPASR